MQHFGRRLAVGRGLEEHLEGQARLTGLGQECLGLGRIVLVGTGQRLVVEGTVLAEEAVHRFALAAVHLLVEFVAVGGEVQGLADLQVGLNPPC